MIHIYQMHLLQANQVLSALNTYDSHNHKVFLLSSKDVPASSVSFLFYFVSVNEVTLKWRALISL